MRLALLSLISLLIAGSAGYYVVALRTWHLRLRSADLENLSEQERFAFVATPEYLRLRNRVRYSIYAATVLGTLLYVVMRLPM